MLLKQLLDLPSHGLFYVTVVMSTSRPWESWKSLRGTCYLIVFLFFFSIFFEGCFFIVLTRMGDAHCRHDMV